ncbi:MAG: hypothetical protein ABIN89_30685 [Chitinophagaceae bacterium]
MNNITRNSFLKHTLKAGAVFMVNNFDLLAHNVPRENQTNFLKDEDILKQLMTANDNQVDRLLTMLNSGESGLSRRIGYYFAQLSASYCSPDSKHFYRPEIVWALEKLAQVLISFQAEDGTLNFGNLESPPDTAFLLEPLLAGAFLLKKEHSPALVNVNNEIRKFSIKCGNALVVGGIHTPNHRWVVSAALARLNTLYPNQKYVNRIEDWLGEGIYNDSDGHFPERSMNYSNVEDNSLITLGRLLNKPALLIPVRRNLEMTYYYMDPNGDLVITDSRRQDQYTSKSIVSFYLHYRYMAVKDKNSHFAAIASFIEHMKEFEEEIISNSLFHFLENELLQEKLPVSTTLPVNYEKLFTSSKLLRIRRGNITSTLFGGVDWPLIIASGRSNSANFFSYCNGKAILKYMRLSTNFFNTGYFYSDGLKKEENKYILYKKLEVPYYQPLPKNLRIASGDYKLSPSVDERFWNKMDFQHRPLSNVKTMETTITLLETNGRNDVSFLVNGPSGIAVTIELCFNEGGKLSGVTTPGNGNSFLENGDGKYEFDGDAIQFGPGAVTHKMINNLEGERYSTHFGTLRTEGMHVYLTGVTPFNHTLTFQ